MHVENLREEINIRFFEYIFPFKTQSIRFVDSFFVDRLDIVYVLIIFIIVFTIFIIKKKEYKYITFIYLQEIKSLCEFFKKDYTHIHLTFFTLNLYYIDIIHDFRLSFALLHLIVIARPYSIYDIRANCLAWRVELPMSLFENLSNVFLRDNLDVESTAQLS